MKVIQLLGTFGLGMFSAWALMLLQKYVDEFNKLRNLSEIQSWEDFEKECKSMSMAEHLDRIYEGQPAKREGQL